MEHKYHHSCHAETPSAQGGSALKAAAHATLHCPSGRMIGELAGLAIGVTTRLASMLS